MSGQPPRVKSSDPRVLGFLEWLLGVDDLRAQMISKVVVVIEGSKPVQVRVTRYPTVKKEEQHGVRRE